MKKSDFVKKMKRHDLVLLGAGYGILMSIIINVLSFFINVADEFEDWQSLEHVIVVLMLWMIFLSLQWFFPCVISGGLFAYLVEKTDKTWIIRILSLIVGFFLYSLGYLFYSTIGFYGKEVFLFWSADFGSMTNSIISMILFYILVSLLIQKKKKWEFFEDRAKETLTDIVYTCLEYVEGMADKIYIYCSYESEVVTGDYFYKINGTIRKKHKINECGPIQYDVSSDRQSTVLRTIVEDTKKIKSLCDEHKREMPTEMKLVYDVKTRKFSADYSYDLMYTHTKDKMSEDVVDEWFEEVKKANSCS